MDRQNHRQFSCYNTSTMKIKNKYLVADASAVAPFTYVSEIGALPISYVGDWIASRQVISVLPNGAPDEFLLKISNNQQSLWGLPPEAHDSSTTTVHVSDNGDIETRPLGASWSLSVIPATQTSTTTYTKGVAMGGVPDGLSRTDRAAYELNAAFTYDSQVTISLVNDAALRREHAKQNLRVVGSSGLLAAMVVNDAIPRQKAASIYTIWFRKDKKWVPQNMSFEAVMRQEQARSRSVNYFWRKNTDTVCCFGF